MKQDEKRIMRVLYVIGIIPIIWIALLLAPYTKGGLIEIIKNGSAALNQPFKIVIVENSIRTILIFLIIYISSILLYPFSEQYSSDIYSGSSSASSTFSFG